MSRIATIPGPGARPGLSAVVACATVLLWVALAALINDSQINDSLEQFVWGQSAEWGYWKHPPLTSWLMWFCLHAFGPSPLWTYVLSALLTALTVACTWKLARELWNADVATVAALLMTLHYGFTRRAQLYNHNTVLVALVALTAVLVLWAARRGGLGRWATAGLAAGLAFLAKYQAVIPLLGLLLALAAAGDLRRHARGVLMALAVAVLVAMPHLVWLVSHDFQTLRYLSGYVEDAAFPGRAYRSGAFVATQFKYYLPLVCFVALLAVAHLVRWMPRPDTTAPVARSREQRAWLIGLVVVPLACVLLAAWVGGMRLQSHWGLQTTQFLVLAVAVWLVRGFGPWSRRHTVLWVGIQVVALAVFIAQGTGRLAMADKRAAVREIPARQLSQRAAEFWAQQTACPWRYVTGHPAMVGMMAAYANQQLLALEDDDARKSPWIDLNDLSARGHLALRVTREPSADAVELSLPLQLPVRAEAHQSGAEYLVIRYHAPQTSCDGR